MFRKHGAKAVFFGRFLFGIRAVTFFVSGSMRVPYWTFVIMDGMAALLTVPISVIMAWHFGGELEKAFEWISHLDTALLIGVSTLALIATGVYLRRRKQKLARVDEALIEAESRSEIEPHRTVELPSSGGAEAAAAAAPHDGGESPAP
jgi:uncharacterized membrane protein YdjX (TVP38/TMEM64 family)